MVFDLDGTVVDSVELIIISFQHAIREVLGREISREESIAWVGRPLREQMVLFSPEHADELVDVYREFNHREHDRMLKLYDGILHLLDGLREGGGEGGSGDLQVALHHADGLRSHRHRETTSTPPCAPTRARATSRRPTPSSSVSSSWGSTPAEAAYVGDSPSDIQAALAAGVRRDRVTWGVFAAEALGR